MRIVQQVLVSTFFLSSALQADAQDATEYDALYSKCVNDIGPINNAVVHACSESVSQKARKEITSRYKSIYTRLRSESPEDAARFEASQKAWLQYKNTHCDLAGSYIGPPMYSFCPMNLNASRALELRELDGK